MVPRQFNNVPKYEQRGTRGQRARFNDGEFSSGILRVVIMSQGTDYRHQAKEAATRVEWCERKLSFERKRRKALDELAKGWNAKDNYKVYFFPLPGK